MTQEERRLIRYNEVKSFIERENRNPSKHCMEGHLMLNFIKHNCKLLNAGKMKADRNEKFNELLALAEKCRRKNQYE